PLAPRRKPYDLRARHARRRPLPRRQARRPLLDAGRRRRAVTRDQVFEFFRRLAEANPAPTTELESGNVYQLLVAVVLSAQATDASVNIATRDLFKRVTTPAQMVAFGEEPLRNTTKTI